MRKLLILFSSIILILLYPLTAAAASYVEAEIATAKLNINDYVVDGRFVKYPILKYKDIFYLPLTDDYAGFLQLEVKSDGKSGLSISKASVARGMASSQCVIRTESVVPVEIFSGTINICGKKINNSKERWPFFIYRGIVYMPLTWDNLKLCGITPSWSAEFGLTLTTPQSGESYVSNSDYDILNNMCFTPHRYHCMGYDGDAEYDFYITTSLEFCGNKVELRADIEGFEGLNSLAVIYQTDTVEPLLGESITYYGDYVEDVRLIGSENINAELLLRFLKMNTVAAKGERRIPNVSSLNALQRLFGDRIIYQLVYNTEAYHRIEESDDAYVRDCTFTFGVVRDTNRGYESVLDAAPGYYRLEITVVD